MDCSVSDSFVTVIGDQMALRRPVFVPSVVCWEVNSVWNIPTRVQQYPADEYALLLKKLQPFEQGRIAGLRDAG